MTVQEMKSMPRGTRVLRTHNMGEKRKKPLVYEKFMDGNDPCASVFRQVKPNGTVVRKDQYLWAREIDYLPLESVYETPDCIEPWSAREGEI
jgi:hypothetical protein